jgi:hypothetical protein
LLAAAPVGLLAIPVIQSSGGTLLVATVGTAPLLAAGLCAAFVATVAMPTVAVLAEEEYFLAPQAPPLS